MKPTRRTILCVAGVVRWSPALVQQLLELTKLCETDGHRFENLKGLWEAHTTEVTNDVR